MISPALLVAAGGVTVARRGADLPHGSVGIRVAGSQEIDVPVERSLDARSADGRVWRRLWSLPDRLVLHFVGVTVIEVRTDGTVVFDRSLEPDVEDHLLLDHVLPLWLAQRGELLLHGAVVVRDGRAIVLTGQSGAGKSTLTAFLGDRSWRVGGDDAAVVRSGPHVNVEATYATVRLLPEAALLLGLPADAGTPVAGKRRHDPSKAVVHHGPAPLAAVVRIVPAPAGARAAFRRLRGASALELLLANTFHVDLGPGRHLAGVLDVLVEVAEAVAVGDIEVPRGRPGLTSADDVLKSVLSA